MCRKQALLCTRGLYARLRGIKSWRYNSKELPCSWTHSHSVEMPGFYLHRTFSRYSIKLNSLQYIAPADKTTLGINHSNDEIIAQALEMVDQSTSVSTLSTEEEELTVTEFYRSVKQLLDKLGHVPTKIGIYIAITLIQETSKDKSILTYLENVALGVSGGVDSMALAYLASQVQKHNTCNSNIKFYAFVINHNMRPDSLQEANQVVQILKLLGLSAYSYNLNVTKKQETMARKLRYEAFARACVEHDIQHMITAHHADDQAETVIMRLLLNKDSFQKRGLYGIRPISDLPNRQTVWGAEGIKLLRPFLDFRKEQLRKTLVNNKVTWYEDPTNQTVQLTRRNTIRYLLQCRTSNKSPIMPTALTLPSIASFAKTMLAQQEFTDQLVDDLLKLCQVVEHYSTSSIHINFHPSFLKVHKQVSRNLLLRLMKKISPLAHIDGRVLDNTLAKILDSMIAHDQEGSPTRTRFTEGLVIFLPVHHKPHTWLLARQPLTNNTVQLQKQFVSYTYPAIRSKEEWILWDNRFWLCLPAMDEATSTALNVREWLIRPTLEVPARLKKLARSLEPIPLELLKTIPVVVARAPDGKRTAVGYPTAGLWMGIFEGNRHCWKWKSKLSLLSET